MIKSDWLQTGTECELFQQQIIGLSKLLRALMSWEILLMRTDFLIPVAAYFELQDAR